MALHASKDCAVLSLIISCIKIEIFKVLKCEIYLLVLILLTHFLPSLRRAPEETLAIRPHPLTLTLSWTIFSAFFSLVPLFPQPSCLYLMLIIFSCDQTNYNLNIALIDANDNGPIFVNLPFVFSVEENSVGATVGTVSVSLVNILSQVPNGPGSIVPLGPQNAEYKVPVFEYNFV